ncbi:MAG: recombination regulator RecX [Lachnospiraceae bacterium]|nr:recombination regulator RecX [Lachnospiraceae bacterium]
MVVTGIVEYTKGKYKIFLNDEFAFVLYKGELRKYGIKQDGILSDDVYHELITVVLTKRAKLRALNLLKVRDYTVNSLRRKLKEGLYPDEVIDDAVEYVISYGYVDDLRYAESYIRSNKTSRSRHEIEQKLRVKGISGDIISEAFENEGPGEEEEEELIRRYLLKKCRSNDISDEASRRKIFAYMYNKGFAPDRVRRILDEVLLDITM